MSSGCWLQQLIVCAAAGSEQLVQIIALRLWHMQAAGAACLSLFTGQHGCCSMRRISGYDAMPCSAVAEPRR